MVWTSFASEAVLASILFFGLVTLCLSDSGSSLRGGSNLILIDRVSKEEVQRTLLEEISNVLNVSSGQQDGRVKEFELELSPMFAALPKNEQGSLHHATVHYALHRFFMEKHGWFFKGLETAGDSWSSTSSAGIRKDGVSAYIQELFEDQLGGRGFALRELAVLAATLEHLVNNEAQQQLRQTFQLLGMPLESKLSTQQFYEVLDTYVVVQVSKLNISSLQPGEIIEKRRTATEAFPEWLEARAVVRDMAVIYGRGMDFRAASIVASESMKHLGLWHNAKCKSKKDGLIRLGDQQVGRVPLASFYADALSGSGRQVSRQSEHIDYLRELGVLDESVSHKPRVLVPNYINSPANCFVASSFYSICCPNECESLLRHLEWQVAGPIAKTSHIQKLVANLPSSTVSAPRELAAPLKDRLQEIAVKHGGLVPLHGRLFAQWLHHAFPRECPYPHAAGATHPQTADEWMADTGRQSTHTREEIQTFVKKASELVVAEDGDGPNPVALPWTDDEEVLVVQHGGTVPAMLAEAELEQGQSLRVLRCVVFVLSLSMLGWITAQRIAGIVRMARATIGRGFKPKKGVFEQHEA